MLYLADEVTTIWAADGPLLCRPGMTKIELEARFCLFLCPDVPWRVGTSCAIAANGTCGMPGAGVRADSVVENCITMEGKSAFVDRFPCKRLKQKTVKKKGVSYPRGGETSAEVSRLRLCLRPARRQSQMPSAQAPRMASRTHHHVI